MARRKAKVAKEHSFPDLRYVRKSVPPVEQRFQKGVSGNPKGRPKGRPNRNSPLTKLAVTHLERALFQRAKFEGPGGEVVQKTIFEALVEIALEQSLAGKVNAFVVTTALAKHLGIMTRTKRAKKVSEMQPKV